MAENTHTSAAKNHHAKGSFAALRIQHKKKWQQKQGLAEALAKKEKQLEAALAERAEKLEKQLEANTEKFLEEPAKGVGTARKDVSDRSSDGDDHSARDGAYSTISDQNVAQVPDQVKTQTVSIPASIHGGYPAPVQAQNQTPPRPQKSEIVVTTSKNQWAPAVPHWTDQMIAAAQRGELAPQPQMTPLIARDIRLGQVVNMPKGSCDFHEHAYFMKVHSVTVENNGSMISVSGRTDFEQNITVTIPADAECENVPDWMWQNARGY